MSDKRRDTTALRKILKAVRAGQIVTYRNLRNEPYVYCDHEKYPAVNVHLFDRDFGDWLYHFVHAETGLLLHQHEANRILRKLSGLSMTNPIARITDKALTQLLETEPTVAVVYEFMFKNPKNPYEQKGEKLWEELRDFARPRQLLSLGRRRFPGGSQVLSRLLKIHKEALLHLGVKIDFRRSNGCIITLHRLDGSSTQPSAEASATKPTQEQGLQPKDDIQARARRLEARKKHQPPREEK